MSTVSNLKLAQLAKLFHALSDESRLRIVQALTRGERCVCDLTAALGVGQSLLSFHLRVLKDASLVKDRRAGRWVYYRLSDEAFQELNDAADFLQPAPEMWSQSDGCCS